MSLINEALKKAQRQRHDAAPADQPESAATPARPIAPRGPAWGSSVVVAATSGALLIIGAVVFFTLRWLAADPEPTPAPRVTPAPKVAATAPAARPTPPAPAPAPTTAPAPAQPTPPPARPAAASPVQATVAAPVTPAAASETPPAPAVEPAAAPVTIPVRAPRPDERIPGYLESLRVAGVRLLDSDSRVLLNDRVFRLNDMVDRGLGLKLIEVRQGTLVFTDANGFRYEKKF